MILLVAATLRELQAAPRAGALVCGIGPVEAALATARAVAGETPDAIVHVGIAGSSALPAGSLVLGQNALYCDLADRDSTLPRVERAEPDAALLAAASRALPDAHVLPIGTTARVGGCDGCAVEAMEGFGVLRAAAEAGVPAVELRAISNRVGERDRSRWRIDDALAALAASVPVLLAALDA